MPDLTLSYSEIALRLIITVILCGIIGFEREIRDQPAGFRTHILLGIGATLFTLISAYGFEPFLRADNVRFDPSRIAAQIVTGVGFLGAGTIIQRGRDIRGLTTAASLWAVAAIGTAVGAGYLFGAAATTIVVMAALLGLRRVRTSLISPLRVEHSELNFTLEDPGSDPSNVIDILTRHSITVRNMDTEVTEGRAHYKLQILIHPPHDVHGALGEIARLSGVEKVSVTGLHNID